MPPARTVPSREDIRTRTESVFGCRPCLWQIQVVEAILKQDRDVISIAGTGMGKTLTFWVLLLFRPKGSIQIIVTPLNILGQQNVTSLEKANIKAIAISAETACPENFRAIEDLEYQAIIISPEQLMKPGGEFERLLHKKPFTDHIVSIVFDEGHCISTWGSFRAEYAEVGRLRYFLPKSIPFMITLATLPPPVLAEVKSTLQLRSNTDIFRCSVDRPNIHLVVRPILSPLNTFEDLKFVLGNWKEGDDPPLKFLVFFDDINEAIRACKFLISLLPAKYHDKIRWFNSDMSTTYKNDETERLTKGDSWGLGTTDSFGMVRPLKIVVKRTDGLKGMDLPDIKLVVQWRVPTKFTTLWQRFGRGARDQALEATAVFLVEKEFIDSERAKKEERKKKRSQNAKKRSRSAADEGRTGLKKMARGTTSTSTLIAADPDLPAIPVDESDSDPEGSDEGDDVMALQARYSTIAKTGAKVSKRKKAELETVMDDFINAAERGLPCRRLPIQAYFENQKASHDPTRCHPDSCQRCVVWAPTLCCDIHRPDAFDQFIVPAIKVKRRPCRSQIKSYAMTNDDFKLREALEDWRERTTIERYGYECLQDLGPMLIMPKEVLQRIVDCVHQGVKLASRDDLGKETKWDEAARYGDEVLVLVHSHAPASSPTPTQTIIRAPIVPVTLNANVARSSPPSGVSKSKSSSTTSKERRCHACGQTGHTARSRICLKQKENHQSSLQFIHYTPE